ncbi:hypothetical protein [Photobacterium nomapromontoriensis]
MLATLVDGDHQASLKVALMVFFSVRIENAGLFEFMTADATRISQW